MILKLEYASESPKKLLKMQSWSQIRPVESESLGLDYRNLNYWKVLEPSNICSIKLEFKEEYLSHLRKGSISIGCLHP